MSLRQTLKLAKAIAPAALDAVEEAEEADDQAACVEVMAFAIAKAIEEYLRKNPERG
jgi:hypothetical protein